MARAWPFEDKPEGGRRQALRARSPEDFAADRGEGVDAVVVRIGNHDAQLVLVDAAGAWQRWVYPTVEDARSAAEPLGVPVHVGEYPEPVRMRMNARRRPPEEFAAGAYPEQGVVGPVLPYPENRPRRVKGAPPADEGS